MSRFPSPVSLFGHFSADPALASAVGSPLSLAGQPAGLHVRRGDAGAAARQRLLAGRAAGEGVLAGDGRNSGQRHTSICLRIFVYFPLLVLKAIYHYWAEANGSIGVLFGCFGRKIDGNSWLTWWFHHLPGPSSSPKRTPMGRDSRDCRWLL